jgi:hypothetical protein
MCFFWKRKLYRALNIGYYFPRFLTYYSSCVHVLPYTILSCGNKLMENSVGVRKDACMQTGTPDLVGALSGRTPNSWSSP